MDKKQFSIAALWLVFGSAFAMLILVLVYKMAYLSAFGIDGACFVSFSELFADMVEPWVLLISNVLILAFIKIWYQNICISARPIGIIRNSKWAEKERDSKKKLLERRAQMQEKGHVPLFEFFIVVILLGVFFWAEIKQHEQGVEMGMNHAIIGLLLPIIIYAGLNLGAKGIAYIIGTSEISAKFKKNVLLSAVEFIVPLFIYAVGLFYYNGLCYGEDIKNCRQTVFEVKTTDGTSYANDIYVYVGQSKNNILLYDRNACKTILLNYQSIAQVQLENNSVLESSLLREWMERLVKK